ncbi:hypothetical protein WJX84_007244 [Apatococcus fuscideae]|uniref:26S proteasome non-ATPase regulatory subunit 2 homolog n=1 Tax=Apatococcus fuscideae TaxID=2026836 RepID=A0AAW1T7U1_9CHLO
MAIEKDTEMKEAAGATQKENYGKKDVGKKKFKNGKPVVEEEELSEEDLELKSRLELFVERVQDSDAGVQGVALDGIGKEVREATTSMTSVPKPLKFLRKHYPGLVQHFKTLSDSSPNFHKYADVLSVLAITSAGEGEHRPSLRFRLQGSQDDIVSWGHEYLRNLAGEIGEEYQSRREAEGSVDDLLALVKQIAPHHMAHNAEPEAVDLLLEAKQLAWLKQYVDEKNYSRTCLYLLSCCAYLPEGDDVTVLRTAYDIYTHMSKWQDALRVALQMNDRSLIEEAFKHASSSRVEQQQQGYLLARQGVRLELEDESSSTHVADEALRESLQGIVGNARLSEWYLALARDLDVMEPRTPDDVYKLHLAEGRQPAGPAVDSARQNMSSSLVNGLVNAGFGQDKLMTVTTEASTSGSDRVHWVFKNKDQGKTVAVASLGLITLWDVGGGLAQIDKYLYSKDPHVVAGALLGVGIINSSVADENDPAFALLYEPMNSSDPVIRSGAILGLALAYAGTGKMEVNDLLLPLVGDTDASMETSALAALALGLTHVASAQEDAVEAILQALMMRSETELADPWAKLLVLGLALLFLGKQEAVEATIEVAKTLNEKISQFCQVSLTACAFAGTGDVLKVQELLGLASQHIETEDSTAWKAAHQGPAVMGIALVAMAEDLGGRMAHRALEHLLQYGDPPIRRSVPLAIALLHVSEPSIGAVDTLSRLSHDADSEVAQNALVALGILRSLSSYYYKEPTMLFLVRAVQGLVHMGKGLLTLHPRHTDGQLLSWVGLASLLTVMFSSLEMKATIGGKHPHLIYCLAPAMRPRMLLTLDEQEQLLPVAVRVGQAVDTVAQAGRPKTITGFQTHTTPVLLSVGERAELGTQKYVPVTPVLEGIVILKPNHEYIDTAD